MVYNWNVKVIESTKSNVSTLKGVALTTLSITSAIIGVLRNTCGATSQFVVRYLDVL